MVHLPTIQERERNYRENKSEILSSGHRFAVIGPNSIEYFDDKKSLYEEHPYFQPNPKTPITFGGTHPLLVDIGKKTNSSEYKLEKNQAEKENLIRRRELTNSRLKSIDSKLEELEKEDLT
ncbi:MAG: hypothetical protein WDZ69_02390 [Candidatus Pacearchaeota archaeon]